MGGLNKDFWIMDNVAAGACSCRVIFTDIKAKITTHNPECTTQHPTFIRLCGFHFAPLWFFKSKVSRIFGAARGRKRVKMAAAKRAASNSFGSSSMVVKRQKSDANLIDGKEIALSNGSARNGALVQAVSLPDIADGIYHPDWR